jgi:tyrosine-specific transport protein
MKAITGIMFVAATCIGSGMIALPITLVKIGIIPSILVMLAMWFIIYYTSLINLELNLQSGKGMALGPLCGFFAGRKTQLFGTTLLTLLSYSLLCAYISIGSSVLENILGVNNLSFIYMILLFAVMYLPSKFVKRFNNFLFIGVIGVIGMLMAFLSTSINWSNIPLFEKSDLPVWSTLLPVVFTSFGFQVIFHTLTDYYKGNPTTLKKVFFWGSLIPAIVYIIWTCSVLGAVHNHSQEFYQKMLNGSVDVSELVLQLSLVANNALVQKLIMYLSFLAVTTSAIGVGLGLVGTLATHFNELIKQNTHTQIPEKVLRLLPPILSVFPAYLIVLVIPNAFISILGFAGMILSLIAIILPIYLLMRVKQNLHYSELNNKFLVVLSFIIGILIVICEILNLLK